MGANSIIVKEYLESLKEDKELDYLFPLLLSIMGFQVITTAKESKGQPQYGKDVVAIGKDKNGKEWRYYFQIKAGKAKDINESTFYEEVNGIRTSLLQAKDTEFGDSTRTDFKNLPKKIVLVHPGGLKENFRPTFKDFIDKEFPNETFEDWHIYELIRLFEEHLFNECLLIDDTAYQIFKRLLVLLDAPGNDFTDIHLLLNHLIQNHSAKSGRKFQKLFASFHLIGAVIFQYSKEANNLHSAKECLTVLLLKVWAWILKENLETDKPALQEFKKLLKLHYEALGFYLERTFEIASSDDGLFSEHGRMFETIGYPIRCFDYLGYLLYFFHATPYYPHFEDSIDAETLYKLKHLQKNMLINLISKNDGCARPLLDSHSIPIVSLFLFLTEEGISQPHVNFLAGYLTGIFENIHLIKMKRGRYPMLGNDLRVLVEYSATGERPLEYVDSTSVLIPTLFELIAILDWEEGYSLFKKRFSKELSLQIPHPLEGKSDFEQRLFEAHLTEEYYVETFHGGFPETLKEYQDKLRKSKNEEIHFRTDKAGFPFLRLLAHLYYKNELPPFEWRRYLQVEEEVAVK